MYLPRKSVWTYKQHNIVHQTLMSDGNILVTATTGYYNDF